MAAMFSPPACSASSAAHSRNPKMVSWVDLPVARRNSRPKWNGEQPASHATLSMDRGLRKSLVMTCRASSTCRAASCASRPLRRLRNSSHATSSTASASALHWAASRFNNLRNCKLPGISRQCIPALRFDDHPVHTASCHPDKCRRRRDIRAASGKLDSHRLASGQNRTRALIKAGR
jgi:hypothetical protein